MGQVQRRIGSLRLRAPSGALARRAELGIEDALRTSSLPGTADGRLWLVRHLALGRLPPDASPRLVSGRLEAAFFAARPHCVHVLAPGSARAPGVWFASACEAHVLLALRLIEGPPPVEWFWPAAVSGWTPTDRGLHGLEKILVSLASLPEAAAAVPAWCAALDVAGHIGVLDTLVATRARLLPVELAALLPAARRRRAGAGRARVRDRQAPESNRAPPPAPHAIETLSTPGRDGVEAPEVVLARGATTSDPEHASALRDRAEALIAGRTPKAPGAPVVGEGAVRSAIQAGSEACRPTLAEASDTRDAAPPEARAREARVADAVTVDDRSRWGAESLHGARTESVANPDATARASQGAPPTARDSGSVAEHPRPEPGLQAEPSAVAGIAFLLPALGRLGFARWLDRHPEWAAQGLPPRILGQAMDRLGAALEDPARRMAALPPPPRAAPSRFVAPEAWRPGLFRGQGPCRRSGTASRGRLFDPSGHLLLAAWHGPRPRCRMSQIAGAVPLDCPGPAGVESPLPDQVAAAWLCAARRWLRRHAGIGLHDLACRPGRIRIGPTHLDVYFDLSAIDIRIRRAGLDLDPGWLPWSGRVVGFHFGREGGA